MKRLPLLLIVATLMSGLHYRMHKRDRFQQRSKQLSPGKGRRQTMDDAQQGLRIDPIQHPGWD